jgi:hypothetical protein
MEPIVAYSLIIVGYCGYLTGKDIVAGLHTDGMQLRFLPGAGLCLRLKNAFGSRAGAKGMSRANVSFIFMRIASAQQRTEDCSDGRATSERGIRQLPN